MVRVVVISLMFICTVYCGLNQLCEMIDFYDKLKALECLAYDNYGCWCGPGGSGKPVDGSDKCCQIHDFCYDKVIAGKKCNPYFQQYLYNDGKCCKQLM